MQTQTGAKPHSGMTDDQITLLKMVLDYLGDQNSRLSTYSQRVASQISLLQGQGNSLQAGDWIQMAQILSVEALRRDIGARRIAESIYPLVDGSERLTPLAYIPAPFATKQLLKFSGLTVSRQIEQLLQGVISELQTMIRGR